MTGKIIETLEERAEKVAEKLYDWNVEPGMMPLWSDLSAKEQEQTRAMRWAYAAIPLIEEAEQAAREECAQWHIKRAESLEREAKAIPRSNEDLRLKYEESAGFHRESARALRALGKE